MGGTGNVVNGTRYHFCDGANVATSTEVYARNMIAEAGSLENLTVTLSAAPGAGTSRTFTVMKNGVAQSLAVTIADAATTASTTANDLGLSAGDRISLRGTVSGAAAAAGAFWSFDFIPTTDQRCTWGSCTVGDISSTAATRYNPIGGTGQTQFISTTAAQAALPWNINATITALYIELDAEPGVGNTWAFSIYKNGSIEITSTITFVSGETTKSVTGLSIAITPTDTLAIEAVPVSGPTSTGIRYGIAYTPTTVGQWNISGGAPDSNDYTDGTFTFINTGQDFESTEGIRLSGAHSAASSPTGDWHIAASYGKLNTAPSGAETRSFTLRKNGSSTANVLSFSGAGVTATSAQAVDFDDGDYVSMLLNKSASATSSIYQWAFRAGGGSAAAAAGGGPSLLLLGVGS